MTTESPGDRVKRLRGFLGFTLKQFGANIGVSASTVLRWESGEAEVTEIVARGIAQAFACRHEWLLRGDEPIWRPGDEWPESVGKDFASDFAFRPLIVGAARCGPGGVIHDPGIGASRYALRKDFAARILAKSGGGAEEDLYFLLCRGESMRPTILDKEIVLLNTALGARLAPHAGGIYLVKRSQEDEEARVKRVRLDAERHELVLASDNRTYMPVTVPLDDVPLHQLVLGRVVWVGRYLLETDPPEGDW